jgi:chemotaxis protein MotA
VTSVAGVPIGIGLILLGQSIEGGSLGSILQLTAAVIVFGGTAGAVLVSFSARDVQAACRSLRRVFIDEEPPLDLTVQQVLQFSHKARKHGILGIEEDLAALPDPFLRKGLTMAMDGVKPKDLREALELESINREEIDEAPARVFEAAGGYSPTIGILGAVLGLIHVMENLSDPTRLGGGIAVAFVATVYGVGAANLIFLPASAKLRVRARDAARRRELAIEGVIAIQEGQNPRLIEEKLRGMIGGRGAPSPGRPAAGVRRAA